MPRQRALRLEAAERFRIAYSDLQPNLASACDRAVLALMRRQPTPGMRVKPILPEKLYYEARISRGDRLVFRIEGETLYLADIVSHDDIDRYGRGPRR